MPDQTKTCSRGHELTPENLSKTGKCKLCRHEREGFQGNTPNSDKTHCPKGHPLLGANLAVYTRDGHEYRVCRICKAERGRSYYWKKLKPAFHPRNKAGRPRKYE